MANGEGLAGRLRAEKIDAFIDTHGGGYVKTAVELGVPKNRINTIIDFTAVQECRVKSEGSADAETAAVLAGLVAEDMLDVPIAKTYPLAEVRAAFAELEKGHTRGKIVLLP